MLTSMQGGGTGNYKGEIIQVPYDTGLGAHKDCIKHDEAANMVYISGLDTGESYCIYLYRTDKACGGCSDEMVDIFPSSGEWCSSRCSKPIFVCSHVSVLTRAHTVGGYEGLSEPAIASVVRKVSQDSRVAPLENRSLMVITQGACPETKTCPLGPA